MVPVDPSAIPHEISLVTRRDILDYLVLRSPSFYGRLDLVAFLKRIWDLAAMPSTDHRFTNAEADIWQHMVSFSDWDENFLLFDYLKLSTSDDRIFLEFLEQCLHPLVLDEPDVITDTLAKFNELLKPDGYQLRIASSLSGRPVYKAYKIDASLDGGGSNVYEVVLSFAGEDRAYVEKVAEFLRSHYVRVFYDRYEEATLWGKDLVEHLDRVYRGTARYCVMFVSEHYAEKVWTTHERRSSLAKALEEKEEYVLPARFDETVIPGLRPTVGYVDLTKKTPEELGQLILQKLGRT